ncbi:MAG TPA: hypothetical protein VIL85_11840 [Thermomicrobiales bacterium]|jgi:hypothetical protein
MSATLTGTALTSAQALARGYEDDHDWLIYLGAQRGDLDEAAIVAGWLPGAGWTEVRDQVALSEGVGIDVTDKGATITLTVYEQSRRVWSPDRAVAVLGRHWFPGQGWGGWYLEAWGYIDGSGQSRHDPDLGQTATVRATYSGYWGRIRVGAHRFGKRNLAAGASIKAASPPLLTPLAEAGVEYISQDSCAPEKAIDQLADTVAVADVFAEPETPAIGQTQLPKFLRVGGPHARGVAAGGQARFAEIWAGHDILGWGSFSDPAAVPERENGDPVTTSNDLLDAAIIDGKYVIHAKAQPQNQSNSVYVGWNIGSSYHGLPAQLSFRVKAGATASIGRTMTLQWGHSGTNHNVFIKLAQTFQTFEIDIDALGSTGVTAGGLNMKFRADRDELVQNDLYFELDDIQLWLGWDSQWYSDREGKALFLGMDDGAGHEALIRLTNLNGGDKLNGGAGISIPPRGSIVVVDDRATFEQQFGSTGKTILQMKGEYPEWFFAPGIGRMKLVYGNDPLRTDYDDASLTGGVLENGAAVPVEEIDFAVANQGNAWLPSQSLSRQNPVGTGFLAVEGFAHLGLIPPYGAAYWWIDLGAFDAPRLTADLPASWAVGQRIPVDDIDQYTEHGLGTIGVERFWWVGKDGDSLIVRERGIGGTAAAAHAAGDAVIPDGYDGQYQNIGTRQTGHNVDLIEIRRKPNTPLILAGAVLTSNLVAPGDPSEGGKKWELHPDWTLVQRFTDRQGNPDVITMSLTDILGGPREVRHVCLVIDRMERLNGLPQRAKVNEIVVKEWRAAGDVSGGWAGHAVTHLSAALGHILTRHAGMPLSKIAVTGSTPQIGDLTVAPAMAGSMIESLGANDGIRARVTRTNGVVIEPTPTNPAYTATAPVWVWAAPLIAGTLQGDWDTPRRVAQARVSGPDPVSFRRHSAAYPRYPGALGEIREVRDARLPTADAAFARAVREFRAGNARRSGGVATGALPWVNVGQRHLLDLPDLDPDGGFESINVVVTGYSIKIGIDDGGVTWDTSIKLNELAMG